MAKNNLIEPKDRIAICLSGGGYRATLFHIGALWRLNEFGYLPKLNRISSVSGGSIAAGWLGKCWQDLDFDKLEVAQNFTDVFVSPLRDFTNRNLDAWVVILGLLNPFRSISQNLIQAYRKYLFGNSTLQDLPNEPEFVINASNVQTGVLFRFSKASAADYKIGGIKNPKIELAVAVAASSAFPPFLSPVTLNVDSKDFSKNQNAELQYEPYTSKIVLMDGGVYDNLGLESIQKSFDIVLISDAGGKMEPDPKPKLFWGVQAYRVLNMMDNQVRALRKRDIMSMFHARENLEEFMRNNKVPVDKELLKQVSRKGTYWGTFTEIANYELEQTLPCPPKKTLELAQLPTRLWGFSKEHQERLINWGYAVCDAAMRKYVDPKLPFDAKFPYEGGVG